MKAHQVLTHEYEFWVHIPKIGPDECRIRVPGKLEKEARKNFSILLKSIRNNKIHVR